MGWTGGLVASAGIVIPIALLFVLAIVNGYVFWQSGVFEDTKGDGGLIEQAKRASLTSVSGRNSQGGTRRLSRDLEEAQTRTGLPAPVPIGLGTQVTPVRSAEPVPAGSGRWQVDMGGGDWKDFEEAHQRDFTTASTNGLPKVEFTLNHQRYELVFAEEVQRNLRSGKTRRVRCFGGDVNPAPSEMPATTVAATPGGLEWQVQMDSGNWIDMEAAINDKINDATRRGASCAYFHSHKQDYELNFAAGTQRNTKTNKERPVRAKPSTGRPPAGAQDGSAGVWD